MLTDSAQQWLRKYLRKLIPPYLSELETKLDLILKQQEQIMSTFDDLAASLASVSTKVTAVQADVNTLIAKLAAIPPAGLTPEQQTALDAAVVSANGIAASLGAIDTEVNPPAPPTS